MDMKLIETICDKIIRPTKRYYKIEQLTPQEFEYQFDFYVREDFIVRNKFGIALKCSHYKPPFPCYKNNQQFPCVIYCHSIEGNKVECLESIRYLLPLNITVVTFDFVGCGTRYSTHGYNEKYDISAIVKYLKDCGTTSSIGLWGRGIGAVASILYAKEDTSIAGMILDTPFSSLNQVIEDIYIAPLRLPKIVSSLYMLIIRNKIKKLARFNVSSLDIAYAAQSITTPAIFVHDKNEKNILKHHSDDVYQKYSGDKYNRAYIDGERSAAFYNSSAIFFYNTLQPPDDVECIYDEDDIKLVTLPSDYENKYNTISTTIMRTISTRCCFKLQQLQLQMEQAHHQQQQQKQLEHINEGVDNEIKSITESMDDGEVESCGDDITIDDEITSDISTPESINRNLRNNITNNSNNNINNDIISNNRKLNFTMSKEFFLS